MADQTGTPQPGVNSFEADLDELEKLVKRMEAGDLPLEEALRLFERGVELGDACRKRLDEAETRIEILLKRNGKAQPQPFQPGKD